MSWLHHVELRPRSLRYYRRKDHKDCAERRRDAVIVDAKTSRFKLDSKRMDTPSGGGWPMSALGHKRTSRSVEAMSALPPKADIGTQPGDVRFVPMADILVAGI